MENTRKKKLVNWLKDKKTHMTMALTLAYANFAIPTNIYGADTAGTANFTNLLETWLKPWLSQIGGIVMLIGGIQFALAWQRQDSESKSSAMLTVMAGAMVAGLAVAWGTFFGRK